MTMKNWKEFCLNVWKWFVRKPKLVAVQKQPVEKVSKGYSPERMKRYLNDRYDFRYNVLSEVNEFRPKGEGQSAFKLLGKRELNALCLEIQSAGIPCWDRDVARYIHSTLVEDYHPFTLYIQELPEWDGQDRLADLAQRVSKEAYWVKHFRRWMLAVMAQWMGKNTTFANCVAPLLVSTEQGRCKSTFCSILLPEELQKFYIDKFDITSVSGCEQKLSLFGLINMDEFDRYGIRTMATLKNLMQLKKLTFRKSHRSYYSQLPRIASFIGTSNQKELLTDTTGSRRFLCVEVREKIDCSGIDHTQLYAQLKAELLNGERYWFTSEEEKEIQANNRAFYKQSPVQEIFHKCFRLPADEKEGRLMTAAEIFCRLQKKFPAALRTSNASQMGKTLQALGVQRTHTRQGNAYLVVPV